MRGFLCVLSAMLCLFGTAGNTYNQLAVIRFAVHTTSEAHVYADVPCFSALLDC